MAIHSESSARPLPQPTYGPYQLSYGDLFKEANTGTPRLPDPVARGLSAPGAVARCCRGR
jgi:hypothetical protein